MDNPQPLEPLPPITPVPPSSSSKVPSVFTPQRHSPLIPIIFMVAIVAVIGGTVFAYTRGYITLPFLSNSAANTNTTANTTAGTNSTNNSAASQDPTQDLAYAACYINAHPEVLQEMPQNVLTESFQDYVTANPVDMECDKLEAAKIEAARSLLITDADHDGVTLVSEGFLGTSDANADTDGNGVNDYQDFFNAGETNTNTGNSTVDTDGDNVSDTLETSTYKTNINKADSDEDGLSDYEEVSGYLTDPLKADSDSDGFLDGNEVCYSYNPLGAGTFSSPLPYPPASCPPQLTPTNTSRPAGPNKTTMTIDGLQASVVAGIATVTWTTKEGAYAAVYFGTTANYDSGRYPDSLGYLTSHTVNFPVTAGTTYHYAVLSCPKTILYLSECALSADQTVVGK